MSGPLLRIRRKRRLVAALRWCAAQEPTVPAEALAPLAERLDAMGAPPGGDLAERIARMEPGGAAPPEVVAMLAAILHPLMNLPARSSDP